MICFCNILLHVHVCIDCILQIHVMFKIIKLCTMCELCICVLVKAIIRLGIYSPVYTRPLNRFGSQLSLSWLSLSWLRVNALNRFTNRYLNQFVNYVTLHWEFISSATADTCNV